MFSPFRIFAVGCCLFALTAFAGNIGNAAPVGDETALAKVQSLLSSVGGEDHWSRRFLYVEETAYLRSGATASVQIWRDLANTTRVIEMTSLGTVYREVLAEDAGYFVRNGERTDYSAEEFAAEKSGIEQAPYFIYHRLAKGDPNLRVTYNEDARKLEVHEVGGRLLCWFLLDEMGAILSWGNIYNGSVNRHIYGPLIDFGEARLPKWGAAIDGGWRFEYTKAVLSEVPHP